MLDKHPQSAKTAQSKADWKAVFCEQIEGQKRVAKELITRSEFTGRPRMVKNFHSLNRRVGSDVLNLGSGKNGALGF